MRGYVLGWLTVLFFLLQFSPLACAGSEFDHQHVQWTSLLSKQVVWEQSRSFVSYKSFPKEPLTQYLTTLTRVDQGEFDKWNRNQQLAFLINVYNAWTIQLILDHYPVKSIKDIGGFFSSPWKKSFFTLFGQKRTLDWLEHKKIRPVYKEPRIHFALVCASKGCPGLRAEAFVAEKLESQLEDSTRRFLQDSDRNHLDISKKQLRLSSIFKWYKDDFILAKGSVQNFVLPYMIMSGEDLQKVGAMILKVDHFDYDWTLNEK